MQLKAFALRIVEAPELDEDGEPVTTMVVDWNVTAADGAYTQSDPWAAPRRQDQRTGVLRLKRVLMCSSPIKVSRLPIVPDGPTARMIDHETVRERFYSRTPANRTPEQKVELRRNVSIGRSIGLRNQQLIAIEEIGGVTYLRLVRPESDDEDEKD